MGKFYRLTIYFTLSCICGTFDELELVDFKSPLD